MQATAISLITGLGALVLAGCTSTGEPRIPSGCSMADCFFARNVRDFEVLKEDTLVVYVGSQRCAYEVELDGIFCDLTVAPAIQFEDLDGRICANDRSYVNAGIFGGLEPDERCRIREVKPLTDDGLIELYVENDAIPPPPPVSPGQVEVGEQEAVTEPAAGESTAQQAEPADD